MYSSEPAAVDVVSVMVVHVVASAVSCNTHQAVYVTLGLTHMATHLAHYLFVSASLVLVSVVRCRRPRLLDVRQTLGIAASQTLISSCTALLHYDGSNGGLYAQRVSDFAVTLLVMAFTKLCCRFRFALLHKQHVPALMLLACATSVCWIENVMTFSWSHLVVWPVLTTCIALHILLVNKAFREKPDDLDFLDFLLNITTVISLFLIPGAVVFSNDHVTREYYDVSSAWEASDYGILFMAYMSLSAMVVTKYWLMCRCSVETYLAAWHCKYLLASFSQLFFHLMANLNVLSGASRILATASLVRYVWARRAVHVEASQLPKSLARNGVTAR